MLFVGWFSQVIKENEAGLYNLQVDRSFRMGMMWFIFSEVMFFAAFFGALFYARQFSVPWLGGQGVKILSNLLLWKDYERGLANQWPGACGRQFRDDSGHRYSGNQHSDPAHERRDGHDCAPCIARRPSHDCSRSFWR